MAAEFVLVTVILLLGLAGYYSMVTYPKQRDFQKRQRYIRTLNVGDEVITYGGIIGRVLDIEADQGIAHVEIAEGVVIRLVTAALMQAYDPEEIAKNAQRGMTGEPGRTEAPPDR
jgi:preprotein translocase YajC subunit